MKNTFLTATVLMFITSCSVQKGEHTKNYNLDDVSSELTIKLKVDETIQLTAAANPSTGYSWNITSPEGCNVDLVKEDSKNLGEEGIVGAPIRNIYEYRGTSTGECIVEFDYNKSWEGKSNQPKRVKFIVK